MTSLSVGRTDGGTDPRHFATSTDDTAIYLEDSMDEPTARCISSSPSAVAILSPQRLPASNGHVIDITEYDDSNIGNGCGTKGTRGCPLSDLTNTSAVRLSFTKSPTPRRSVSSSELPRRSNSSHASSSLQQRQQQQTHLHRHHHLHNGKGSVSTEQCLDSSPQGERMVPLADYERIQRERNRYEKMYEHQKALYEDMAQKQNDTYRDLQRKITEVVALSTRNEENKRFIRQLKRDMADNRTRVMDIQNRVLEESKLERNAREQYQKQLREYEEKHSLLIEKQETKLAGLESLLKDVTCVKGECDRIQVSQLDALLKAAYAKNTALFGDLLRQGRQIDLLFDSKTSLEKQLDQLRREKRELEAAWAEEQRRMMEGAERYSAQVAEQQRCILELRQMLIRTLEPEVLAQKEGRDDNDTDETDSSSYSSGSSSQDTRGLEDEEDEEEEREEEDDEDDGGEKKECLESTVVFAVGGSNDVVEKKATSPPPLPHAERRATDLATLSASIHAKLKSLPSERI